jgi:hypothetical protein
MKKFYIIIILLLVVLIGETIFILSQRSEKSEPLTEKGVPMDQSCFGGKCGYANGMMKDILQKLNVKNITLTKASFGWNSSIGKITLNGYEFTQKYTPAQNAQIAKTWQNTSKIDDIDVITRFESELRNIGFKLDASNSGDATFHGQEGYVKGNVACLAKMDSETRTTPSGGTEGTGYSMVTISCADIL